MLARTSDKATTTAKAASVSLTEKQQDRIISHIEDGLTLRAIALLENISPSRIVKTAKADEAFGKRYACAQEMRTDSDFEQLAELQSELPPIVDGRVDPGWVQWRRLQVDSMKWALSKRIPAKYGDKLEHTGSIGIQTVMLPTPAKDAPALTAGEPEWED